MSSTTPPTTFVAFCTLAILAWPALMESSDIVENYMRIIPKAIDPDGDFNEAVSDDIMRDIYARFQRI
jgi:hypothetical protein